MNRFRLAVLAALTLAVVALSATLAYGWANNGDWFGTHDWVLYEADRLAESGGFGWVNLDVALPATDDPDYVFRDYWYHHYDVWGDPYGDAPTRIGQLYDQTVAQLAARDLTEASRSMGLLAHYYADIHNPLHTDETPAEGAVHGPFEVDVGIRTDSVGENRAWVSADPLAYVDDATASAVSAATFAHEYYEALVGGYVTGGFDPGVEGITRQVMSRAVNSLADLIVSIKADAAAVDLDITLVPYPRRGILIGGASTLNGQATLSGTTIPPPEGTPVELQSHFASGLSSQVFGRQATSAIAGGNFSFSVSPRESTMYRVVSGSSVSPEVRVDVRPPISLSAPAAAPKSTYFDVVGALVPDVAGNRIQIMMYRNGRLATMARGVVAPDGGFRITTRIPTIGVWQLYAAFPPTADDRFEGNAAGPVTVVAY